MRGRHPRALHLLVSATLLAGCAVGPDFHPPAPPRVSGYSPRPLSATESAPSRAGASQRFVQGMDIPGQWWTLFRSAALNVLIARSLKANPSIDSAQAALRQATETMYAQQGAYFPSISVTPTVSRNLTPIKALSAATASGNPYYTLITPQLSVSFVPDVFGANRRAVESLAAQAEAQRFQLEATYLTLTSNVVAGAVQEASLRGQIAAAEETIRIDANLLAILRRQNALGQVAMADVLAQEATLAQARQALPPLQKQLAQQRDQLAALSGGFPSEELSQTFTLDSLRLPRELPLSLPSRLVAQRPDVRAAEANLHAASAQIGVAVAARVPQISLTATLGSTALQVGNLFAPGYNFWTVAGSLTQPIFEGGALLHRQRAARAAFDQAAAQYRSTVLSAFQNVADTLHALQSDAVALRAAAAADSAAARSLAIVRQQLRLGQVAYLSLLNAEQTSQQARLALVQAQANRFADTAALFQALGGGWWNRADVAG